MKMFDFMKYFRQFLKHNSRDSLICIYTARVLQISLIKATNKYVAQEKRIDQDVEIKIKNNEIFTGEY